MRTCSSRRRVVALVGLGFALSGLVVACVPPGPTPWGVHVGDCYTIDDGPAPISFLYVGPADSADNTAFFNDQTCTVPFPVDLGLRPIVRATDETNAEAACLNLDPSLTATAPSLFDAGWYLVSGAGTPGDPISADTWGCSTPAPPP
jgi:hypothetical protein